MQLSAKALLKPFCASPKNDNDTEGNGDEDGEGGVEPIDEDSDDDVEEDEPSDDEEEEEDPFEKLNEVDREQLLEDTAAVRATLNKVLTAVAVVFCSNY